VALDHEVDLANVDDFARAIWQFSYANDVGKMGITNANGMYCVRCGGTRRMVIRRIHWMGDADTERALFEKSAGAKPGTPGLFAVSCTQCQLRHDVLVHLGPDGPEIAVFSAERGGFSTPNTPPSVKYYLDQAHRSESVGATSAAVTMYRSALEMLLYDQGYTNGMLDQKIKDLSADTKAPAWRDRIDSEYLDVMKKLGNKAVHPNDGDVEKQKVLDRSLLQQLRTVFEELLDQVYERPAIEAARKAKLSAAAESFKP
jgi:hypothetical protein